MITSNIFLRAALLALWQIVAASAFDLRLITHNIRYAADTPGEGERFWLERRPLVASQLYHELAGNPETLLCLQEALYEQVEDIKADLGGDWEYFGVGRDDGVQEGEFSPILYSPDTWDIRSSKTYWLSETPEKVGSVGWDASLPRIATVAKFEHRATGLPFVYMCTHFDHQGTVAQKKSAELVVQIAEEWAANTTTPVFLGGDLNVDPSSAAYQTLASGMTDAAEAVPKERHHGFEKTFTGFVVGGEQGKRIDFLFALDPDVVDWVSFATLNTLWDEGFFSSDHRPVVVDVQV